MKGYRYFRRAGNAALFFILGGIFVALGILSFFWLTLPFAVFSLVFGVLLAVLPQFVVFSRYSLRGGRLRFCSFGIPRSIPLERVGAVVICVDEEYRQWKGYFPVTVRIFAGEIEIPSVSFLRSADEDELDLCDTRTAVRNCFFKEFITDGALDPALLPALAQAYAGKVYVSEYVYELYKPAFEGLFGERLTVYTRIPKAAEKYRGQK